MKGLGELDGLLIGRLMVKMAAWLEYLALFSLDVMRDRPVWLVVFMSHVHIAILMSQQLFATDLKRPKELSREGGRRAYDSGGGCDLPSLF